MSLSIYVCLVTSNPLSPWAKTVLTLFTAVKTLLPIKFFLSPSLNSRASYFPVEAPDGTAALKRPCYVITSASTVGFPLES